MRHLSYNQFKIGLNYWLTMDFKADSHKIKG